VTLFGLFLTPVFFYVIRGVFRERPPVIEPAAVAINGASPTHRVATPIVAASSNSKARHSAD
jgi:hypothetical protein